MLSIYVSSLTESLCGKRQDHGQGQRASSVSTGVGSDVHALVAIVAAAVAAAVQVIAGVPPGEERCRAPDLVEGQRLWWRRVDRVAAETWESTAFKSVHFVILSLQEREGTAGRFRFG